MQLQENSFYTNQQEKDAFISDKQGVASAFFINFLGTLGLFSISSNRGIMKTYFPDDAKMQLKNIGDANKDVSLAVKLYTDQGGIRPDTANKITRLLYKMKTRAITAKTLDENIIRELVNEMPWRAHRPHPMIVNVVEAFAKGDATLKQTAKAMYKLVKSRKKDFLPLSSEFYDIARQYLPYFKNIPDIGVAQTPGNAAVSTSPSTTQATTPVASDPKTNPAVNQVPKTVVTPTASVPKPEPAKATSPEEIYNALWMSRSRAELNKIIKQYSLPTDPTELTVFIRKCANDLGLMDNEEKARRLLLSIDVEEWKKAFGYLLRTQKFDTWYHNLIVRFAGAQPNPLKCLDILSANLPSVKFVFSKFRHATMFERATSPMGLLDWVLRPVFNEYYKRILNFVPGQSHDDLLRTYGPDGIVSKVPELRTFLRKPDITVRMISLIFSDNSGYSKQEQLKLGFFLVLTDHSARTEILQKLLDKHSVQYRKSMESYKPILILPDYKTLFPHSDVLLKDWDIDDVLVLGELDPMDDILDSFKRGTLYSKMGTVMIDIDWTTTSPEAFSKKIVEGLKERIKTADDYKMAYALIHSLPKFWRETESSKTQILVHSGLCEILREAISKDPSIIDSLNLDKHDILSSVSRDYDKNNSTVNDSQRAIQTVTKAIVDNSKELRDELLEKMFMEEPGFPSAYNNVFKNLGVTLEDAVRERIQNKKSFHNYEYWLRLPTVVPYITVDYLKWLLETGSTTKVKALAIANAAKIDPLQLFTIDELKSAIFQTIKGVFFVPDSLIDTIKESPPNIKDEIIASLKGNLFREKGGVVNVDPTNIRVFWSILSETEKKEFVSGLTGAKEKAFARYSNIDFYRYSSTEGLNRIFRSEIKDPERMGFPKMGLLQRVLPRKAELDVASIRLLVEQSSKFNRSMKPSERREFEQTLAKALLLLRERDALGAEEEFAKLSIEDRRTVMKYFTEGKFIEESLNQIIGDDVLIKPYGKIDEIRLAEILKYNNVTLPRRPVIKDGDTISSALAKVKVEEPVRDLSVTVDELDPEALERMSVEYDAFNRYAHGQIAVKFLRSFNVSVPLQEEGFKLWAQKMAAEGINSKIMKPVFHGTGSVGALMILRYGFRVVRSNDPSVVGRMLGDGIYFSNVLDKVAQYVGDKGFGRQIGTRGYIFEMEASLGKPGRDYKAAGADDVASVRSTVSPEWVVFTPNEQLRIYKCFEVDLIKKEQMEELKSKHLKEGEETAVKITRFKNFINEGKGDMKHCITYIFMDGDIPVSETEKVEFEKFNARRFGNHVKLDWTGSGPSVMIYNNKESATYVVRYTREFMQDQKSDFKKYLKLLKG